MEQIQRAGGRWRVASDLNWRRLKYWRRLLTQALDPTAAAGAAESATEIVVGLPIALSGRETASTQDAREFAALIAVSSPDAPVRLVDERLSTVSAQQALRAAGRTAKNSRNVIDQVAAVIILQHALDFERASGTPPGTLVVP